MIPMVSLDGDLAFALQGCDVLASTSTELPDVQWASGLRAVVATE